LISILKASEYLGSGMITFNVKVFV